MYIVISYRPNAEVNTGCGCHPEYDRFDSGAKAFESIIEVANYIALWDFKTEHAQSDHYIFKEWKDFLAYAKSASESLESQPSGNIFMPCDASDDNDDHELERKVLAEITERVTSELNRLRSEEAAKEKEEKERKLAEQKEREIADKRATLERLKKELEA